MSQVKISKTLASLINNASNFHEFQILRQNLEADGYDKTSLEITRIYQTDGIICGEDTTTAEDVFFFLKYKGFEIKTPLYRVILPDVHCTGGCYWDYVFLNEQGEIDKEDRFGLISKLTEEELKNLPEWAQALATEVTE